MNGIEALHHLRADPRTREIPVIAVTASVMNHQILGRTDGSGAHWPCIGSGDRAQ
jgi:CheY-like chemotaxis protein